MVLWVGVDDTDSLRGMCTTFLATELVRELSSDFDFIGYPRLVRLNPNIPWKTRGNGAVCIAIGKGQGPPFRIGSIDGEALQAYPRGRTSGDPASLVVRLSTVVERWSDLDADGTDPGLLVIERKPPASLYWKAVRGVVTREEAMAAISGLGVSRGWKSGRGLIGASAACAWRPNDRTWELLAYRARSRWGSLRDVDEDSVRRMDRRFPSTFNNYDYENRHVVIAPSSPCPVLFGIRGDAPHDLPRALSRLRGEQPDRWLVFETNQGTDDHVLPRRPPNPRTAGTLRGVVTRAPCTLPGGHVVFGLGDYDVTAYEPSKQLRGVVRSLAAGDRVTVIGSLRESPRTVNLEKLEVVSLARIREKISNPVCPFCAIRMKSMGTGTGFRCRRCRRTARRSRARYAVLPRRLAPGWYEPPVSARRHLSKPLKRGFPAA